jgi:hypothetical protein
MNRQAQHGSNPEREKWFERAAILHLGGADIGPMGIITLTALALCGKEVSDRANHERVPARQRGRDG